MQSHHYDWISQIQLKALIYLPILLLLGMYGFFIFSSYYKLFCMHICVLTCVLTQVHLQKWTYQVGDCNFQIFWYMFSVYLPAISGFGNFASTSKPKRSLFCFNLSQSNKQKNKYYLVKHLFSLTTINIDTFSVMLRNPLSFGKLFFYLQLTFSLKVQS